MNRNKIVRIGAIVMILSMLITIFIGAMSVKAATLPSSVQMAQKMATTGSSAARQGVNPDIDGDGILNNDDGDIDGDGIENAQDGNPASTNDVDSVPPKDARVEVTWQWAGGIGVLAVLGWLVALPYLRKRKGTSSRSVGNRG
jgi:hypothetical protein